MTRKQVDLLCSLLGGFFVYTVCLLSFVEMRDGTSKVAVAFLFGVPAAVLLAIAAAVKRFVGWQWQLGAVLVSSAGLTASVVLTAALLMLSPEVREMYRSSGVGFFSDYKTGGITTAAVGVVGIALMWRARRKLGTANPPADSTG